MPTHILGSKIMKTKCINIVICVLAFLSCESCVNHVQQKSQGGEWQDTIIVEEDTFIPDKEYIVSLIREDFMKRNWHAFIDTTFSPLFYKTLHDDNIIILYRVIPHGEKTCVAAIEDLNIAVYGDDICYTDTNGVVYEHNGHYEIVDDSTVNIFFDDLYSNHHPVNDSVTIEPIYHRNCMHSYRLYDLVWKRIKADTTIVLDKRDESYCEDLWRYTE